MMYDWEQTVMIYIKFTVTVKKKKKRDWLNKTCNYDEAIILANYICS